MEDGLQKQVIEQYAIDALSYAEAENRIIEEMSHYISGAYEVVDIKKAAYKEVFFDEGDNCSDRYYRAKLSFITIDEKTEKEKKSAVNYLVQAGSLEDARKNIDEVMGTTMIDYTISGLNDTTIMDVFEYKKEDTDSAE